MSRGVSFAIAVCLVGALMTSARAASDSGASSSVTAVAGTTYLHAGLPPPPTATSGIPIQDDGLGFDPLKTTVSKAKLTLTFPPIVLRAYNHLCIQNKPEDCADLHPKHPDAAITWLVIHAVTYVQSPAGDPRRYGDFPSLPIGFLAFGSIPGAATLEVSEPASGGCPAPLTLDWVTSEGQLPAGLNLPGFGPVPGSDYEFFGAPLITGKVVVRLRDVTIDKEPLNVGAHCQTTASITLTARPGYAEAGTTPVSGDPAEYNPFLVPSYLHGSLDLPAFSGCRNGSEDLDPLITGLVSGPGNSVNVTQTTELKDWCGYQPSDCPAPPGS